MITPRSTLQDVTGLQRPSAIRRWLDREKIPYLIGVDNWPRVSQEVIEGRLKGESKVTTREPKVKDWRCA